MNRSASSTLRDCLLTGVVAVVCASPAQGQAVHDVDIVIRQGADGAIETGLVGQSGIEWGKRVVRGRLDLSQFPNLTDDPGFDSQGGAFPAGTLIGLDLLAALREWDGDSFEDIDPDFAMSVTKGSSVVTTPPADQRVPGFTFGAADGGGRFHHHVRFFLDPYDISQPIPGMWLLEIELWSTNAAVLPSEPVFIVFASGAQAVAQQDDAVAWVEQNLLGGPCSIADLAEPFGILDLADIAAFIAAFVEEDPLADLSEPFGVFDLQDITVFVSAFVAGCP